MRDEQGGARLMAHQALTLAALRENTADIVINRAMTGDGKSFAGQYFPLIEGWDTMTLYPTNELTFDQHQSLRALLNGWEPDRWRGKEVGFLHAARLDEIEASVDVTRPEAMMKVLDKYAYLLTNPDIFHLIMNFRYHKYGSRVSLLPEEVARYYRLITFDEFGLFGVPQVASVMSAILLMREMSVQQPRFLFLSATPQELLVRAAQCVGLNICQIQGEYQHGFPEHPAYRRILQEVDLYLHGARMEDWVRQHADLISQFYAQHRPCAKGILICNGVGTAYRVHQLLAQVCPEINIGSEPNTGLTPLSERERSADLLVATSTIDVGVDFRINFLVFESMDAASHLQRLGRLGRHRTDAQGNPFPAFAAHALLPAWVVERLEQRFPDGSRVDRDGTDNPSYRDALQEAYPPLQSFERYLRKWGGVQSDHVLARLDHAEIRAQMEAQRERLRATYDRLYKLNGKRYYALKHKPAIFSEAVAFRGSSPFTVLVKQSKGKDTISSYNLLSLLLQADLQPADLKAYYAEAERRGQSRKVLERANPLAAYELKGWLPETRKISFGLRQELEAHDLTQVIELDGVVLNIDSGKPLNELRRLNDALDQRQFAARLIPEAPDDLRRRLKLGYHFGLYPFSGKIWRSDEERVESISGSVAFARDALLLDSIYYPPQEQRPDQAFIC
jgi:CRISPR-associated endonuclease/helicase Cas3